MPQEVVTVVQLPVTMTRAEAEQFMILINECREQNAACIIGISRKRQPLRELSKMAEPYQNRLDMLVKLQEKIGTVFNLGGY